jgi:ABC-2 type transport system permease protein
MSTLPAFIALMRKDLLLYFSNRRALVTSIAAPILIAAFFGSLFGAKPDTPSRIPLAISDQDHSPLSARLLAGLRANPSFELSEADEAAATEQVRQGKVRAAVVLPAGFGVAAPAALLGAAAKPVVTLHYDPSQSAVLALVRGLVTQQLMEAVSQTAFSGRPALSLPFETREIEASAAPAEPYNSYAHSFAGMSVQFILFMGVELGIGVLLARRLGLWKRLRAAPVSRSVLLGSRIASGALTALILLLIIYAAAIAVFGVRVQGSWLGFAGVCLAFSLLTASFGMLIAALGKTPEATRGLTIFVTLIMVMLGGAWVPSFIFPPWLQTVSLFMPTRWAVDGLDAMTWRGLGLQAALAPIGVTLAFSALFAGLAIWRFDWEE